MTLLIDAGDSFYSYSTNYIYDNYPDAVQPIYQAMNQMRYDCITLGNHDFDHPWDYLYDQLDRSGLLERTFVSNAVYTESGELPFRSSAIFTRKMKTSEGRTVQVKVGVVGATYTGFSQRRYVYGALFLVYVRDTGEGTVRARKGFMGMGAHNRVHRGKLCDARAGVVGGVCAAEQPDAAVDKGAGRAGRQSCRGARRNPPDPLGFPEGQNHGCRCFRLRPQSDRLHQGGPGYR